MLNFLVLTALWFTIPSQVCSVEVYRIGGADQPVPDDPGIVFHQLHWEDFQDQAGLDPAALGACVLQPIRTEPEINIAATAVARGGGPWVQVTGESRGITENSKTLTDGIYDTIYEWLEVSGSTISGRFLQPT